jgi:phosphinothricin acetyltransferase
MKPSHEGNLTHAGHSSQEVNLSVRSYRDADAADLADIYGYYVENYAYSFEYVPPTVAAMAQRMEQIQTFYPAFVCVDTTTQQILGYATGHAYHERTAYQWNVETSIYVRHGITARGVGSLLYAALLPALQHQGFTRAIAIIAEPNPASVHFHQKMGFTHMATFPHMGYKLGAWHDIIYYVRELNPPTLPIEAPISYLQSVHTP